MRFVDLIEKKAEGAVLSESEIKWMITEYVAGEIPDYQMSAMLMAILQKDMNAKETADLTMAMMHSGDVVDLSDLPGVKVDKHSTGGVGDTTTLIVAPLVAACGGTVAKMSGRGLGHTGGTLDKLESIPGTSVEQSMESFRKIVKENGVAVIGQSGNLVPADKKMYALRDVTATVRSIPLIASSIMSKKLASGADAIVLDVKTGSGAFMREKKDAFALAERMVEIGSHLGRNVSAVITDMNQPLGNAVGNALEVKEAVEVLSGAVSEDAALVQVCLLLGEQMLMVTGLADTREEGREKLLDALHSGEGLKRLQNMIRLQGGDSSYLCMERIDELCTVKQYVDVCAEKDGYVSSMDTEAIGTAAQMLGAGRATKEDVIDPAVGLIMKARLGDKVEKGDVLAKFYVNDDTRLEESRKHFINAITISEEKPDVPPYFYGLVTKDGTQEA